jgi:hypothetical protein
VISEDPLLGGGSNSSNSSSSSRGSSSTALPPLVLLCRSLWHAPDRDGRMEVQMLPGQLPPGHRWARTQQLAALQAPDVASDVMVAQFISDAAPQLVGGPWPLL